MCGILGLPTKAFDTGALPAMDAPTESLRAGLVSECDAFYNPRQYVQAGGIPVTRAACAAVRLLGGAITWPKLGLG